MDCHGCNAIVIVIENNVTVFNFFYCLLAKSEVTCHDVRGSPLPPASLDFKTGTFFVIFENLFEEEENNLESSEFLDYPRPRLDRWNHVCSFAGLLILLIFRFFFNQPIGAD